MCEDSGRDLAAQVKKKAKARETTNLAAEKAVTVASGAQVCVCVFGLCRFIVCMHAQVKKLYCFIAVHLSVLHLTSATFTSVHSWQHGLWAHCLCSQHALCVCVALQTLLFSHAFAVGSRTACGLSVCDDSTG